MNGLFKYPVFVVLVATATPVVGDQHDVDTSQWLCRFCPDVSGWSGEIRPGAGWAGDSSPRFADYRGIDDRGLFMSLSGKTQFRADGGQWLDARASDLGIEAARISVQGGRYGHYRWNFSAARTPRHPFTGAGSPYSGVGSMTLSLPQDWSHAAVTSGMVTLPGSLKPVSLEIDRDTVRAGFASAFGSGWNWKAGVTHERKQGTQPLGIGVFTVHSATVPAPVDLRSNAVELALNYTGQRGGLKLAWNSDRLDNRAPTVTVANPFTPVGLTSVLRASLEPDNEAHRFSLAGSFRPDPNWRFSVQGSLGEARQDDAFLPYSINPDFDDLQLPRGTLGGLVESRAMNLSGRVSARITRNLSFDLKLRSDDRDNRSPVDAWTPVITDVVPRPDTYNRPYSFERDDYQASLSWRQDAWRLNGGIGRKERHRSLQSVRETREDLAWGELTFNTGSAASVRLKAESSSRDMSPYQPFVDPGLVENPLMRKFNLAGRERDKVALDWDFAGGLKWNASLSLQQASDEYRESGLGLMDSDTQGIHLDFSYASGPGSAFHAFAGLDRMDSEIRGAISDDAEPWMATTRDRFRTVGAGYHNTSNRHWNVSVNLVHARALGDISTRSGLEVSAFPSLKTRLFNARAALDYRDEGPWSWSLSAEYERFRASDWQIDGIGADGVDAILLLGNESPDSSILLMRLQGVYRF